MINLELTTWAHHFTGRQRRWFKIDEAIAELSVHKPSQCNYVRLLCKNCPDHSATNQINTISDTVSNPPTSTENANLRRNLVGDGLHVSNETVINDK